MMLRATAVGLTCGWVLWCGGAVISAAEPAPEALEFFEKRVRPILVEHCHKCHAGQESKGGLRLDSGTAVLKGGDTGPAVVPGNPEAGTLIEAVRYDPDGYQMPPTGKLPDEAIAALVEWVRQGAVWPLGEGEPVAGGHEFNLEERLQHWSFQPLQKSVPPETQDPAWAQSPIDRFILARLESQRLTPSPPVDRRLLLRRLSFDLLGLPPSWEEVADFAQDTRPDAWDRAIDRLLASPQYGERWARHWLDLVRFAETGGHEFDFEIPYAAPYRDYIVRALNADLPYDQLIREHLAGDLLPSPRIDPATGRNESVVGTAFYWFGQGKHSPVDIRSEECDTVDNQLDVLGKTFLGLTIACSRCHDHKFDPIPQRDYYALAGFLQSSRRTIVDTNRQEVREQIAAALEQHAARHLPQLLAEAAGRAQQFVDDLPRRLLSEDAADVAWRESFQKAAAADRTHPLHLWAHWNAQQNLPRLIADWQRVSTREDETRRTLAAQAPEQSLMPPASQHPAERPPTPWFYEDVAFRPARTLPWLMGDSARQPIRGVSSGDWWAQSGSNAPQFRGSLRSPTFTITAPYIDYWLQRIGGNTQTGRQNKNGQVHLIVDGFQVIRSPLYGHLSLQVEPGAPSRWYRQDVRRFLGSRAYIEIEDVDDGELRVLDIAFREDGLPPIPFNAAIARELSTAPVTTADELAQACQRTLQRAVDLLQQESQAAEPGLLLHAAESAPLLDLVNFLLEQTPASQPSELAQRFAAERQALLAQLSEPAWTIAMTDGTAEDERLLIRGNHRKPGEAVPREFLVALQPVTRNGALGPAEGDAGSGRLELAECIAHPQNPLTARVMVNRLWQHHYGRGLVPTPDDFGKMGQPPTHPELLDWLAAEFIRSGWSIKHMHRLMLRSATYQQSSHLAQADFVERDPQNLWWHRMPVRRLEAEPIRDALLHLSGRLDDRLFGPSVLPHLTPFMEGRGRPGSGPLDGDGRRSLYINVRRNFLSPMFLAFDFPTPFTTTGRRSTSNVPAQALTMMNNPLVVQQTRLWAERVLARSADRDARIDRLYQEAFSRLPAPEERAAAVEFLGEQPDLSSWQDLAHVLVNSKGFVFVE